MLEIALKLLKTICKNGFSAYIVGGFVRDYLLDIKSNDIDINTNATPKQIKEIFNESCLPSEDYGSVTVIKNGIRFEITTFRKDLEYIDHRRPSEIQYIDNLYDDLLRRDFTINTLCMDENGKIIDLLNGTLDIKNKIVKTVGNPIDKFREDSLRILRAVRFATILDFKLDNETKSAIIRCKNLLNNLSYYRKKEELDKIFVSPYAQKGIDLLIELGLDEALELKNLDCVKCTNNLIGIWSLLNVVDKYPFTNNEKELIKEVNVALKLNNLDPMALYKHGLYVNCVAGEIKGLDIKKITDSYNKLTIQSRKDLDITSRDIMTILNKKPGNYLKDIYDDLEYEVLYRKIQNKNDILIKYILEKFS